MQPWYFSSSRSRALLAAALALPLATSALANVVKAAYSSPTQFIYEIAQMPDFDQKRDDAPGILGLPGSGGMYCVPTSTLNLAAYAANHGFPEVLPGPGNWQSPSRYNLATQAILTMGVLMSTDPVDGTTSGNREAGAEAWFGVSGQFVVESLRASVTFTPTLEHIARAGINGKLVAFCYGRYDVVDNFAGLPVLERDGGHCMTLVKAARAGSDQFLLARDPADDGSLFSQSTFMNSRNATQDFPFYVHAFGPLYFPRIGTALNYIPGNNRVAIIDSALFISPKSGYSFMPQANAIKIHRQTFPMNPPPPPASLTPPAGMLDSVAAPFGEAFYSLAVGPSGTQLARTDALTGASRVVADVPWSQRLLFGRQLELYTLGGEMIRCYDSDPNITLVAERVMPAVGDAFAYDDATDRLYVVDLGGHRLLRYQKRLTGTVEVFSVPASLPLGGLATVNLNPADGSVWLSTSVAGKLVRGIETGIGSWSWSEVNLPAVQHIISFDFDDLGHLFVSSAGVLREFMEDDFGNWVEVLDSEFAGLPAGTGLRISRSRTNYDPAVHDGPAWADLPADSASIGTPVPDAKGDMNCDGVVDFRDIDPLVAALSGETTYNAQFPTCNWLNGDTNFDDQVSFNDIDPFVALLGTD